MKKQEILEQIIPRWHAALKIVKDEKKPDEERLAACRQMRGLANHLSHPPDDYLPGGSLHGEPEEIVLSGWSLDYGIAHDVDQELLRRKKEARRGKPKQLGGPQDGREHEDDCTEHSKQASEPARTDNQPR